MSIAVTELYDSREGTVSSDAAAQQPTRKYAVTGTDDEFVARAYLQGQLAAFVDGQPFNNYRIVPAGGGVWYATAYYGRKKAAGTVTIDFETGSEKIRITRATSWSYYAANKPSGAPQEQIDFQGALNMKESSGNRKAEGIDEDVDSGLNLRITRTFGPGFPLNSSYVNYLRLLKNHINDADLDFTVRGIDFHCAAGELLFQKASGTDKAGGSEIGDAPGWEGDLSLWFAIQDNLEDATIAGVADVDKKGWDYVEVVYEQNIANLQLLPRVRQVNVNTVKPSGDLSVLFPDVPTVDGFSPANGGAFTTVTVYGTNLYGVYSVQFNGVPAMFAMISPTSLTAVVPATATTGPIKVVAAGGSAQSASDFVVA